MDKIWCLLFGHNWREGGMPSFRFFCSRCGGVGNISYAQHRVHADTGKSVASSGIVHASAESKSQTESTPVQRG